MGDIYVARDSVQLVGVQVAATTVAGTTVDPTGYAVSVAVLPITTDDPSEGDWKVASWQSGTLGKFAVLLIGTGSSIGALAVGRYRLWAKITASPEVPVIRSPDQLIIH